MKTHWKSLTDPNYLGAWFLEDGRDVVLTIRNVQLEKVTGTDGKKDDCVVCHFYENVKPMILNVTNMKMISKLYNSDFIEDWVGRKICIGVERVAAFGAGVDALRVRDSVPNDKQDENPASQKTPKCTDCKNDITPVNGFSAQQLAAYTKNKYGRALCEQCAMKAAEKALSAGQNRGGT